MTDLIEDNRISTRDQARFHSAMLTIQKVLESTVLVLICLDDREQVFMLPRPDMTDQLVDLLALVDWEAQRRAWREFSE